MERFVAADRRAVHRSQRHPEMLGRRTQLGRVLALQRMAGNRAVSQLVQRFPRTPTPLKPEELVGPVPKPFEGAVSEDLYKDLPDDLKRIMAKSFAKPAQCWNDRFDRDQKLAVAAIYNRFQRFGLWGSVSRISQVKKSTPPIWCKFRVQADTPSIEFDGDAEGLSKALLASPKMCHDTPLGASLHPGQSSYREVSDTDSLHISVGTPTDQKAGPFSTAGRRLFDAHIDRFSSPLGKKGLFCEYDPQRSVRHIGNEAVPGILTKDKYKLRVPFNIFPDQPPQWRPEMFERPHEHRDQAPPSIIGITAHW